MSKAKTRGPLLRVENLRVEFPTRRGTLVAVDDISFHINEGEVLGVVGESGAGKSLTGAAIIGLLEPPGRVAGGQINFDGKRIDDIGSEEMRRLRGSQIAMIFQDPLTSLNPLFTVGRVPSNFSMRSAYRPRITGLTSILMSFRAACANAS